MNGKKSLRVEDTWLVEDEGRCACAADRGEPHEPICGLIPLVDLATLPGWGGHLTAAPSATREEVGRSIPVDALAALVTGHGGSFETGLWRVELAFPLSEPVSVDSWRQDLLDAITLKENR